MMKQQLLLLVATIASGACLGQDVGRVISSTPAVQQVAVPRQVCTTETPAQVQNAQRCWTQTFYENRAVSYNVVYEYAGKQYSVQMPNDPGPTVRLQITPVDAVAQTPAPVIVEAHSQPVILQPPVVMMASPAYSGYYPYSYVPPISIGLGFGYWGGGYRGHPYRR